MRVDRFHLAAWTPPDAARVALRINGSSCFNTESDGCNLSVHQGRILGGKRIIPEKEYQIVARCRRGIKIATRRIKVRENVGLALGAADISGGGR